MRRAAKGALLFLAVLIVCGGILVFLGKTAERVDWQAAAQRESSAALDNADCGFYHMRGYWIDGSQDVEVEPQGRLELVQINLGGFLNGPVSEAGLAQIDAILAAYEAQGTRLILRFLYDWDGKGMERDPASLQVVLGHMEQMRPLLAAHESAVYIVQGVFVGSWAEMHSSRYLSEENVRTLLAQMERTVPSGAFLAVRTPSYWRLAAGRREPLDAEEAFARETLASRLSLFNDGILGNWLDCGTYGETPRADSASLSDRWPREEELAFQQELNLYVPNGGEVVLDNPLNDFSQAVEALRCMHVSYLNAEHDLNVLHKWEQAVYEGEEEAYRGMDGLSYVDRHLGYRFVVRGAQVKTEGWLRKTATLTVEVENVGFAPRYTPGRVEIVFQPEEGGEPVVTEAETDVRGWKPGETVRISAEAPEGIGRYEVFLRAAGGQNGEPILFANEGTHADGAVALGVLTKEKGGLFS